jgi:PPE-repeat protein
MAFLRYVLVCVLLPPAAYADVGLTKVADISFGQIDYSGSTGNGNITMGSNGVVVYGNNTSGNGFGTPGQIEITGDEGTVVAIACSTGELARTGASNLQINPVRFNIGSANVGAYVNGIECAGIDQTVTTHVISATPAENVMYLGGQLVVNGQSLDNGLYEGGASGGSMPAVRILLQ